MRLWKLGLGLPDHVGHGMDPVGPSPTWGPCPQPSVRASPQRASLPPHSAGTGVGVDGRKVSRGMGWAPGAGLSPWGPGVRLSLGSETPGWTWALHSGPGHRP